MNIPTRGKKNVNQEIGASEKTLSFPHHILDPNRSNTKHLILTLANYEIIPAWVADILLKWGDLQDA